MVKPVKSKKSQKSIKKLVKMEIIGKLTEALREYKTPKSEKKLAQKIKKVGKSITPVVLKSKKKDSGVSEKKSA